MGPFEGKLDGKDTGTNQIRISLDADAGDVIVGGNGRGGDVILRDDANAIKIRLDAGGAEEAVGRQPVANILLSGDAGEITLRADAYDHTRLNGAGNLWLGGKKAGGDVFLFEEGVEDNRNADKATIHLDGDAGRITLGANGK